MSDTIDIPATTAVDPDTLERLLQFLGHMDLWDVFSHRISKEGRAEVRVDENGYAWIRVFVDAEHTYGEVQNPPKVKHGIGFIVHLSDMWTLSENGETPFTHCDRCKGKSCKKLTSPFVAKELT